jgi:hypothetical protein
MKLKSAGRSLGAFLVSFLLISSFLINPAYSSTGGSMSFAGNSSSFLSISSDPDIRIGNNNFTIEWWQYSLGGTSWPRIYSINNSHNAVSIEGGTFYFWADGTPYNFGNVGSGLNEWVHYAVVRSSGTVRVYKNGVDQGNSRSLSTNFSDTSSLLIGKTARNNDGETYKGYLTNFHWVNGTAKYTSNFTPTYPPISATANSKLLLRAASSATLNQDSSGLNKSVSNTNVSFNSAYPSAPVTTLSTPATPTADPTTGTLKSIAVSWSAVTNASSYTLKLYASNGTTLLKTIAGLNSTSRTITTSDYALADGTTYQVSITAIGNGTTFLDSLESTKRSVTTSQTLSSASLSSALATSATLKSINLSWSAIANAASYTIKIYDANDSLLATRTSISGTSKTINSTDLPAIADSTLYKFSIQAIGNNTSFLSSTESSKMSATTHAPVSVSINRELTNPYSSRSIKYTFTFSETITGFTTSNLTLAGTSTGWSKGDLQGSGSNYSITITNSSPNDGSINLSLTNTGISATSSSVQPPSTNATTFNLGRATQVNTWIKFLWGENLVRF